MEKLIIGQAHYPPYHRHGSDDIAEAHPIEGLLKIIAGSKETVIDTREPGWIRNKLIDIYNEGQDLLNEVLNKVNAAEGFEDPELQDEEIQKHRDALVSPALSQLSEVLAGHVEAAFAKIEAVNRIIYASTAPPPAQSDMSAILNELRAREIREHFKAINAQQRIELIEKGMAKDDLRLLHAVLDDPVQPLVAGDGFDQMRQDYSFKRWPWLKQWRDDCERIALRTLEKARKILGAANLIAFKRVGVELQPTEDIWRKYGMLSTDKYDQRGARLSSTEKRRKIK
jgi:hypothetical protein